MSSRKILDYAVSFLLVVCCSSITSCRAQNGQSVCVPSSCGNMGSIRYPFRLRTDPTHCGKPGYELDCRNNQTIITFKSKSFHVESINYSNYTIRMTDPGLVQESNLCSFPDYTLGDNDVPYDYFTTITPRKINTALNNYVVFVDCLNAVNFPRYSLLNDTSCSRNSSRGYRYLAVMDYTTMSLADFGGSCSADKVAWVSLTGPPINASVAGIRRSLAYGFELSWHGVLCDECEPGKTCSVTDYRVTCETPKTYCYEDTPYEKKSFKCKLDFLAPFFFFYGGGGILAVLILRFLFGLCCIAVLASREKNRSRLWEMRHKDDQVFSSEVNAEHISK